MPHYLEISYSDEQTTEELDGALKDLAGKYSGQISGSSADGGRRKLEFIFPHFAQCSGFSADIQANHPAVTVDRFS